MDIEDYELSLWLFNGMDQIRLAMPSLRLKENCMSLLNGTTQFHNMAGLPTGEWADLGHAERTMVDNLPMTAKGFIALRDLRLNLLKEEVTEYIQGELTGDIIEIVDGLLDTIVIAWGTLLAYVGEERAIAAANEVVRSNLSKVDGTLGPIVRREDGKLLKPPGWTPPDIEGALVNGFHTDHRR